MKYLPYFIESHSPLESTCPADGGGRGKHSHPDCYRDVPKCSIFVTICKMLNHNTLITNKLKNVTTGGTPGGTKRNKISPSVYT